MEIAEVILKEYEEARYNFTINFGNLINQSGSIVLQSPDLNNSIYGLFYQTARDCKVTRLFIQADALSVLLISIDSKPNIKILDPQNSSKSMNDTLDILNKYIDDCEKMNFSSILKNVQLINNNWSNNNINWRVEYFAKFKSDEKAK